MTEHRNVFSLNPNVNDSFEEACGPEDMTQSSRRRRILPPDPPSAKRYLLRLLLPIAVLAFHIAVITPGMLIDLHWAAVVVLFGYLCLIGETKRFWIELTLARRVKKTWLLAALGAVLCGAAVILILTVGSYEGLIYTLWAPFWSRPQLLLWAVVYAFGQPLVDTLIFQRLLQTPTNRSWAQFTLACSLFLRCWVEVDGLSGLFHADTLAMAFFVTVAVPALFYLFTKNTVVSYAIEVLYRITLVLVVLWVLLPQIP